MNNIINRIVINRVEKLLNDLEILVGEVIDKEISAQESNKLSELIEQGKLSKSHQRKILIINFQIIVLKQIV